MRVLITGASSGIGAETARRLARRGDDVVLVARGREGLDKVAKAIRDQGGFAVVETADVTDRDEITRAVDRAAEQLGGLDAVVVNAGAAAYGLFKDTSPEDVERTLAVTFTGAVNTVRAALPHLERTNGTLVATGSVAGKYPQPLLATYSAAKHALRGFIESLRLELRATGSKARVGLVHPGPVDTPFWTNVTPATVMPPEFPPQATYSPEQIAKALIRAIDQPSPEHVVGIAMKAIALVPRPLRDLAMTRIVRTALNHPGDDEPGRAIHEPAGKGQIRVLAKR
jgi:short-subunit dehydrogenase